MRYSVVEAVWTLVRAVAGKRLLRENRVVASFSRPVPSGPFLLLANHAHALDPYVVGTLIGRPVRYMANIEGVPPAAAAFAGLVGAFGKRKGMPDFGALRTAMNHLGNGEPVGIFPEGDRSWDGRTAPLHMGIARLAKIARVPVLLAKQRGSYLTFPRWADARRSGLWSVEFTLIEANTVAESPLDDLYRVIRAGLEHDEVAWAGRMGLRFECDAPARGASRALWACPHCGAAGRTIDDDSTVRCLDCGSAWTVDANCGVQALSGHGRAFFGGPGRASTMPRDIPSWIAWQRAYSSILVRTDLSMRIGARVAGLSRLEPGRPVRLGPGRLSVSAAGLAFEPDSGGPVQKFPAGQIEGLVDNFNRHCAFSRGAERWTFDHRSAHPLMWIDLVGAARSGLASASPARDAAI